MRDDKWMSYWLAEIAYYRDARDEVQARGLSTVWLNVALARFCYLAAVGDKAYEVLS